MPDAPVDMSLVNPELTLREFIIIASEPNGLRDYAPVAKAFYIWTLQVTGEDISYTEREWWVQFMRFAMDHYPKPNHDIHPSWLRQLTEDMEAKRL